jgi:hypothetical protein
MGGLLQDWLPCDGMSQLDFDFDFDLWLAGGRKRSY